MWYLNEKPLLIQICYTIFYKHMSTNRMISNKIHIAQKFVKIVFVLPTPLNKFHNRFSFFGYHTKSIFLNFLPKLKIDIGDEYITII